MILYNKSIEMIEKHRFYAPVAHAQSLLLVLAVDRNSLYKPLSLGR